MEVKKGEKTKEKQKGYKGERRRREGEDKRRVERPTKVEKLMRERSNNLTDSGTV